MKFLLDIPLVMSFADWVWGEDEKVSPSYCVEQLFSFDTDCWTRLIVKGLGIAIILGACLNKAPVMLNLWRSKSTVGLSTISVYGETLVYVNAAVYGMLSGHPITAYGENLALFVQSLIIVFLMWEFSVPPASTFERGFVNLLMAVYLTALYTALPKEYYYLLMTSIMPVLFYSRGSQILETMRCQHTGAQSIVTNTMNLAGGLVRVLTTIKEVGWDMAILGNYALSCTLNLIVFLQYFYYRKNTERFLADLQSKAKKE